jgi:hypothetical protein
MEKKVFFLLKVKTKIKARWIEHIIKSQIGVNWAIVDFEKRIILIEFDSKLITAQYMRMLVRSLGSDLVLDDKEILNKQNQLGNLLVIKRRIIVFFILFVVSILGLFSPFSNWLELAFSVVALVLYFSLYVNVLNRHFNRSFWLIDRIGFLFYILFLYFGLTKMFFLNSSVVESICFFVSIIIVQIIFFYRWVKEKSKAEIYLL